MIWPQLILWVVSFLLTDYFRERLPSQTASGIGDFNIPTATEGRPVPIITGGTVRVEAPNCIWYGDFAAVERTTTTGIVFKREEVIGYRYELALQYALFKGPSVGITGIWIGDERVFDHVADAGGVPQDFVDVDRDDLFGGKDNGGGFQGRIRLHKGSETQAVSTFLDSRLTPCPAYRGLSYIVVSNLATQVLSGWLLETVAAETRGAVIGEGNQLRYIRVEVQTFDDIAGSAGSPGLGDTLSLGNNHHFIGPDLNPIVAAWDLWTSARNGRGFGLADVNLANFQAAAETCWSEGLGWTNLIDEQTTTGAIQDKIEQHIDGYIGPNPLTGQIEVTLARPDYVLANLPLINEDNLLEVKEWSQGDWSNTKNRIRIRYTSRSKNWKETHAVETAAGNRIIQGRTVTEEIRFEGCHTDAVAQVIAARAKRGLSIPLQKGTIVVDRTGYALKPGQAFRITSNQTKTTDLPVRVTKITLGDMVRQSIELSVVEDIFGNEPSTVEVNPPSDFVPPIQAVIPFTADSQAALEPPFLLMIYDEQPGTTPRIATLARRNAGNRPTEYATLQRNSAGTPTGAYTSLTPNVNGGFSAVGLLRNAELGAQVGNGTLTIQVDPFAGESLDALIGAYDPRGTDARGVAVISPGLADEEFVIFTNVIDDGAGIQLTGVSRSAMDTPWKEHAAGAGIWFIWTGGFGMNLFTYASPRNVEIKLLPISPNDQVLEGDATPLPIVAIDATTDVRATKPLVPIELNMNGSIFPASVDFAATQTAPDPDIVGAEIIPIHRLATVPDVRWSVEARNAVGSLLTAADLVGQNLDVSVWIYDTERGTNRSDAVASVLNQAVVTPTDPIYIEKADMIAGGATGLTFPAQIEVETRHSPDGLTANNLAHESLRFEFLATGVFSVLTSDLVMVQHFDGVDAATVTDETSDSNRFVKFYGGAQIDTAQSVFGGASMYFDGIDSYLRVPNDGRSPFRVNEDWTIEFRIRWDTSIAGAQAVIGQWDDRFKSWALYYNGSTGWGILYTTTGDNGPFSSAVLGGNWTPAPDTWYAVAMEKKGNSFQLYIDGVLNGTSSFSPAWFLNTSDWLIGARKNTNTPGGEDYFFTGWLDEIRVTPGAIYGATYTPETIQFDDGRGNYGFLAHLEDVNLATTTPSDDLFGFTISTTGTSEIDTSQFKFGSSSLRCDGVNNFANDALQDGADLVETLSPLTNNAWSFGRGDFHFSGFFRLNALPSTNAGNGFALIGKAWRGTSGGFDWIIQLPSTDTQLSFSRSPNGAISSSQALTVTIPTLVVDGAWHHWAYERVGNDLNAYYDGNRVGQTIDFFASSPDMWNNDSPSGGHNKVTIGKLGGLGSSSGPRKRAFNGWLDEYNVEKRNLYNGAATYTVPTAPWTDPLKVLAADEEDPLVYLHGFEVTGNYATDWGELTRSEDRGRSLALFGGSAQFNTANSKFGTSSLLLDGFGDYLQISTSTVRHNLLDSDFTVDLWADMDILPQNSSNAGLCLISNWSELNSQRSWSFYMDDTGTSSDLVFAWTTDGITVKKAFVLDYIPTINTWTHFAVVRQGANLYIFVDGVLQTLDGASASIGTDVIFESTYPMLIGFMSTNPVGTEREFDGHLDEVRILKEAAYTSTFTPETSPYPRSTGRVWF